MSWIIIIMNIDKENRWNFGILPCLAKLSYKT